MKDIYESSDKTLIDQLLEEQKAIETPVGRLADDANRRSEFGGGRIYQSLIPTTVPAAGSQYGFEIDLDRCSGCKGCVTACHSLNGLDESETWRDVGALVETEGASSFQQTITTACHHCVDPACLNGCPVNAYEKDALTGIVLHLDDQCIGCQYCVLKCPYDVPKYNADRGIVRKCDMCYSRLSNGEAPACVDACPHEAIKIVVVDQSELRAATGIDTRLVPSSPKSEYTLPATTYTSKRPLNKGLEAADAGSTRVQPAHWPLVFMLALTQLGCGGYAVLWALGDSPSGLRLAVVSGVSWLLLHSGLIASVAHLGRPLKAWRVFLGLGKSWLSREAVVFGAVSLSASLATLGAFGFTFPGTKGSLAATVFLGLLAIFCSAYLYHDTRRVYWRLPTTLAKFTCTTAIGGIALALLFDLATGIATIGLLVSVAVVKMWIERASLRRQGVPLPSSQLVFGPLRSIWRGRLALMAIGIAALSLSSFVPAGVAWGVAGVMALFSGEILERALFFKAVDAPKMPGGFN